jgi:hypothetical protein
MKRMKIRLTAFILTIMLLTSLQYNFLSSIQTETQKEDSKTFLEYDKESSILKLL